MDNASKRVYYKSGTYIIRGNYFQKAQNVEAPNVGFYLEVLEWFVLIESIYINLKKY